MTADLPFRFSFDHALSARRSTTNVFVRVVLDDGSIGYGEGIPRGYVTSETVGGALQALRATYAPALIGRTFHDPGELGALLAASSGSAAKAFSPGAYCALELACLDAAGRSFGRSVASWLSGNRAPAVRYDAIVPFAPTVVTAALAAAARAAGVRRVKVKVGRDIQADLRTLATVRRVLGADAEIRVDANCAWSADEALVALEGMRRYRIWAVEQPVPRDDLAGLKRVTSEAPETVFADESLCTPDDAELLARERGCDGFNLRISKCGGLLRATQIATIAERAGLKCIVGAQVGESGILSAAGRHLAAHVPQCGVEGSAGTLLLERDLVRERVLPGRRGHARVHTGPGLGVTVRPERLERVATVHTTLTRESL